MPTVLRCEVFAPGPGFSEESPRTYMRLQVHTPRCQTVQEIGALDLHTCVLGPAVVIWCDSIGETAREPPFQLGVYLNPGGSWRFIYMPPITRNRDVPWTLLHRQLILNSIVPSVQVESTSYGSRTSVIPSLIDS